MGRRADLNRWKRNPASVTPDEIIAEAKNRGWSVERISGSHVVLSFPGFPKVLSVPLTTNASPTKRALIKLMQEAERG